MSNDELPVRIYSAESPARHPGELLREVWRDMLDGRELAWRLAIRDIKAQYRQTALGLSWVLILPLANTLLWLFLSGSGVVQIAETPVPYPIWVFSGTMLWAIFMEAMNAPLKQAQASTSMLTKINFPREALVLSGIVQTLFNGAIKIGVLLVVLLMFGDGAGWQLFLFPLGVASLILAGTAFGLLLVPVGLLYADIGKGLPLLLLFLMYFTPVVYPLPSDGWAATLFMLNPLTSLILTTRDWLLGTSTDLFGVFLLVNVLVIMLLLVVAVMFRLAMPVLIERMGS
jgi:lipopolysaccharide transport system permease protein